MKWSTTPPDKPGFYYFRLAGFSESQRVGQVRDDAGGFTVQMDNRVVRISNLAGLEWSGPIPEPQEAASV